MSQNLAGSDERPRLAIFISSPGDVAEERVIAKRILDRLTSEFAPVVELDPFFWEHEPLLANDTFQAEIMRRLRPAEADIVVCILWSRLGTRLPPQFARPDGSTYNAATEFELEDALLGYRQHGKPDLLVYRKTAEPLVSLKDTQAASQAIRQKMMLDEFVQRFFHGGDGTLIASFHNFDNTADFEALLEEHLRKLIQERMRKRGIRPPAPAASSCPTWTEGSPFRGLQAFDFDHHAIFFGRTRAIGEVLERWKRQAADGRAFLLVLGVSGCGKSSLVRAGVLPDLVQPGVVEGVGLWRRAIMRPGERSGDLFDGLAAALQQDEALPELTGDGTTVEQLAGLLRTNPEAAPYLVKGALAQAAGRLLKAESSPVQPVVKLVMALDQLEEIFTADDLSPSQGEAFFRAIRALAESGQTWIIATLRSDFYPRCSEITALAALKSGLGQYDVRQPDASEIAQLIRCPTLAAGLQFEPEDPRTGQRLDDLLRDAAAASRDSLPLLEFTLDELYRLRSGNTLTLQAYHDLGGMEGALARRADEVFTGLPAAAQSTLPYVFRQLVAIKNDDEDTPVRKRAPLGPFDESAPGRENTPDAGPSPARQLVDAFIAARLLTAKRTDDGVPVVEVAHEALLSHWQPLVGWLRDDRELLRIRGRVGAQAARWVQEGRRTCLLLQTGKPLDEGLQLQSARFPLEAVEREFIANSLAAARRRTRLRRCTIAAFCLLTVLAILAAVTAGVMSVHATANARRADDNARNAESQTREALAAKVLAETQLQRARMAEYAVKIGVAQRDLAEGDVMHAEKMLAACAGDLRGWEHRFLWAAVCKRRMVFIGHADSILTAAFSPDGRRIVSGSADRTLKVWDAATGRETLTLTGHDREIRSAAFSPDGRRIVSGSDDALLKVWDAATGHVIATLAGHTDAVSGVVFSPDGRRIASGSWDRTLKIWDAATGQEIRTLSGHAREVRTAAFSPDGRQIVSGSYDNTLKVWDAASGKETMTLRGHAGGVKSVAFSPDGRRIASGSRDKTVKVWDATTGKELMTLKQHASEVWSVAFSPDGRRILSGSDDKTIKIWDAATGKELLTLAGHTGPVASAAFSPDGRRIVSASRDQSLKTWDATTGREILTIKGRSEPAAHAALGSDGPQGASTNRDQSPTVPDAVGQDVTTLAGHALTVTSVAFSPDGRWIVSGSWDHMLKIWDLSTNREALTLKEHTGEVWSAAYSPDGRRIVSASWDRTLKIWDAATGREVSTLRGHTDGVLIAAFSPDGRRVVSGSADKTLKIWDAAAGREISTLRGHTDGVMCAAFSPDGRRIVSAGYDRTLKIWDAATGWELLTLRGHTRTITCAAFSPDGRRIASCGYDETLKIWDAVTGREISTLRGHIGEVWSVAFGPDGLRIVSGGIDKTLKLWDTMTGQEILTLRGHSDGVSCAVFSPDGRRIASGSWDRTLKVWNAPPEQKMQSSHAPSAASGLRRPPDL
jgi:WD40 repeat protein